MARAGKKPCRICRRWFEPDVRVGKRQRACSKGECQTVRRKRTQADWRSRNRDYDVARRIIERPTKDPPADAPRQPSPLNRLPWDLAQDEFGSKGADFIGVMGRLLLCAAQDQFAAYLIDSKELRARLPAAAAQDQIRTAAE